MEAAMPGAQPDTPRRAPADNAEEVREYVVLREEDGRYGEVATVKASSAPQARRLAAEKHIADDVVEKGVELRAIPRRSWDSGAGTVRIKREVRYVDE